MRTKYVCSMLMMTAVVLSFAFNSAEASGVNVNISGFLPAPPGVHVQIDAGRPYYVQSHRRVYMEREPNYRKKHHKRKHHREKRHHDNGNRHGHDGHEGRGGHGR